MGDKLLAVDLQMILDEGQHDAVREFFEDHHPAAIAEIIKDIDVERGDAILLMLDPRLRAETLSYFDRQRQVETMESIDPGEAASIFQYMPHDDRADLVNSLDEDKAETILRRLAHAEREDIRRLSSYEPGTAGAVMTTDYATLAPHLSVREAIERLRHEAPDRETIDYSYVIDHRRKLLGIVSLKQLILERSQTRIESIMQDDFIKAKIDEDQEEVARKIAQYDLLAIPVVDDEETLLGIVTHDDAMDILREEQAEDLLAFGGVSSPAGDGDPNYWQVTIPNVVRQRLIWLLPLFLSGTLTSWVVGSFDWLQAKLPELVVFVPLLIGTGGNAGSQTVGTIIRGLALGEIEFRDAIWVLLRESSTGVLLGALLGLLGFFYAWVWKGMEPRFAAVIAFTVLGICLWANSVGAVVPLLARRMGWDPAHVSAPLISTLVDVTGLFIYYVIAMLIFAQVT